LSLLALGELCSEEDYKRFLAMLDRHDQPKKPDCYGGYMYGQVAAERDCETCPYITGCQPAQHDRPGKKFDHDKPRWDLLPYDAMGAVVDVLTHGATKYGPENWRQVEGWQRRYFAAALRHLVAYFQGNDTDDESGLPHLAHATCCVLFLLAKEMEGDDGRT
jgi:hypothetical protein